MANFYQNETYIFATSLFKNVSAPLADAVLAHSLSKVIACDYSNYCW